MNQAEVHHERCDESVSFEYMMIQQYAIVGRTGFDLLKGKLIGILRK